MGIILLLIFALFLKLNPKNHSTVNAHRCKTLVALVFFMTMFRVEKIETPSIIRKETQKLNKRKTNLKKDVMKKIQNIGFGLGFILILWCKFH
jgi:hypothetical protein